jgi:hypothetical protein
MGFTNWLNEFAMVPTEVNKARPLVRKPKAIGNEHTDNGDEKKRTTAETFYVKCGPE